MRQLVHHYIPYFSALLLNIDRVVVGADGVNQVTTKLPELMSPAIFDPFEDYLSNLRHFARLRVDYLCLRVSEKGINNSGVPNC